MTIELLKKLEKYPLKGNKASRGLSLPQIEELELEFCPNGVQFPKALREFLFLAGEYCVYFDSGVWMPLSQFKALQQRTWSKINSMPYSFSFTNIWAFGFQIASTNFYFIDLVQLKDDPDIYFTDLYQVLIETGAHAEYYEKTNYTLVSYIEKHISYYLETGSTFDY
jgi:hypothetical protein